jgi:hypothetical protein
MKFLQRNVWGSAREKSRRGVAAVELALLSPLLALIFMGMAELSRGMMMKVMLSSSARMGCRAGIQRDKGNADILYDSTRVIQDYGFTSSKFNPPSLGSITITVTAPDGTSLPDSLDAPSGSIISVKVSIPAASTTWVPQVFITEGSLESETVVMMKQ